MSLGLRIRVARVAMSWTRAELAERIGGVKADTVGRWERGQQRPTLEQAAELERAFGWEPGATVRWVTE